MTGASLGLAGSRVRISNNIAVQILLQKTIMCGTETASLRKVTVLQGIHAGERGYFLATDLSAARDLNH